MFVGTLESLGLNGLKLQALIEGNSLFSLSKIQSRRVLYKSAPSAVMMIL